MTPEETAACPHDDTPTRDGANTMRSPSRLPLLNLNKPIYPAHVMAAIVGTLADEGIPAADALRHSDIDPLALHSPATRLSMRQMLLVCRNALALSTDPLVALRAGARMHIAACGIYGYALLSSPSHAHAVDFALKYDRMLGQFADMSFERADGRATWTVHMNLATDATDPLYRFLLEYKLAGTLTVMKDLYGADFRFGGVCVMHPAPDHADHYRSVFGCATEFGQEVNSFWFDAQRMEQRMAYADTITNATVHELCDQALEKMSLPPGLAGTVHAMLVAQPGQFPDVDTMAETMGMNARTLRRKLDTEGTSYRQILTEVRTHLAIRYLRTTDLTNEEIAARLGYSDSANFRHAFTRWTCSSPSEYRSR